MSTDKAETELEESENKDENESAILEELTEVEHVDPAELRCGITLQNDSEP